MGGRPLGEATLVTGVVCIIGVESLGKVISIGFDGEETMHEDFCCGICFVFTERLGLAPVFTRFGSSGDLSRRL